MSSAAAAQGMTDVAPRFARPGGIAASCSAHPAVERKLRSVSPRRCTGSGFWPGRRLPKCVTQRRIPRPGALAKAAAQAAHQIVLRREAKAIGSSVCSGGANLALAAGAGAAGRSARPVCQSRQAPSSGEDGGHSDQMILRIGHCLRRARRRIRPCRRRRQLGVDVELAAEALGAVRRRFRGRCDTGRSRCRVRTHLAGPVPRDTTAGPLVMFTNCGSMSAQLPPLQVGAGTSPTACRTDRGR